MSKNVTWSYRKRFEDGNAVFVYKKLLGYRKGEDGMLEIVPEEAALVARIFNMYLAGETPRKISAIISDTITLLKNRINGVQQLANSDGSPNDQLEQIQQVIEARKQNKFQFDDSIVRQMIECIKVYPDGKLEIIFGGGYIVEESLMTSN